MTIGNSYHTKIGNIRFIVGTTSGGQYIQITGTGLVPLLHDCYFDLRFRDCWGWEFAHKRFGGSIATIGSTGLSWLSIEYGGGGNNWINLQFFKEYANGTEIIGDVWKKAICAYLDEFPIDWDTPNAGISSLSLKLVDLQFGQTASFVR
jgi:hypothetical protein